MPKPLRRAHTAAAVLLATVTAALCVPSIAAAAVQPRLIVGFTDGATSTAQRASLGRSGVRVKSTLPALDAVVVQVEPGTLAATRARLLARPDVAWVELDGVAHAYGLDAQARDGLAVAWRPNDTMLTQQWSIATLGLEAAWERTRGTGVTIAVLDTGVDYIHPDLTGRVDLGRDFVDRDDDPMDVQGHGTHVAGIAAANTDDGFGVAGVAPASRILAVRVLDANGAGNYSQVANGIVYAVQKGARVINLSLGGPEKSELLRAALDYAAARGAIVTCATGNESAKSIGYPARYDSCVAVGATTEDDAIAPFSNQGAGIDVSAPGAQILSSTMGGGHEAWDGTSMAAPHVAGTAALLLSQGLGRRDALAALVSTARDLGAGGPDTTFGAGRIDVAAATEAASRRPRGVADTVAPSVAQISVGAARRTTATTWKTSWKLQRRTGFVRVGTSYFVGTYSYSRTAVRGSVRTVTTFRYRGGIVYRRTVTHVRTRTPIRTTTTTMPVQVVAADDQAVDRVAVQVDGRMQGVDWTPGDGWSIDVACTPGSHDVAAWAYDVADNEGGGKIQHRFAC